MGFIEKFEFEEPKLLAFYLGGRTEGCQTELHDVVFTTAKNLREAVPKIKAQWFGTERSLHVDSWMPLEKVDGFDISLTQDMDHQNEDNLKLFFVNIGCYKQGVFGELHILKFVVADSVQLAKEKAKQELPRDVEEVHTDDIYDIDDCIMIEEVEDYKIVIESTNKKTQAAPINGWQRFPSSL